MEKLKYLIVGSGGTGGSIGAFLSSVGNDVAFIARGSHKEQMSEYGLRMRGTLRGDFLVRTVKTCTMDEYNEKPDVMFICVKEYSLDEAVEFAVRVAQPGTVVIPLLNIYGTGERMSENLPGITVTDGCIYISARISAPGEITHEGTIFKVVFGLRPGQSDADIETLRRVESDLKTAGIETVLSENIKRDTFKKFAYVSPMAAAGQFYRADAGTFQSHGEQRDLFEALIRELVNLAKNMGIEFENDIVKENLAILDSLTSTANTSMQRDIRAGKNSEIYGLIFNVLDMAMKYNTEMPIYTRIIAELL